MLGIPGSDHSDNTTPQQSRINTQRTDRQAFSRARGERGGLTGWPEVGREDSVDMRECKEERKLLCYSLDVSGAMRLQSDLWSASSRAK